MSIVDDFFQGRSADRTFEELKLAFMSKPQHNDNNGRSADRTFEELKLVAQASARAGWCCRSADRTFEELKLQA